jgi:hypothetical protein
MTSEEETDKVRKETETKKEKWVAVKGLPATSGSSSDTS